MRWFLGRAPGEPRTVSRGCPAPAAGTALVRLQQADPRALDQRGGGGDGLGSDCGASSAGCSVTGRRPGLISPVDSATPHTITAAQISIHCVMRSPRNTRAVEHREHRHQEGHGQRARRPGAFRSAGRTGCRPGRCTPRRAPAIASQACRLGIVRRPEPERRQGQQQRGADLAAGGGGQRRHAAQIAARGAGREAVAQAGRQAGRHRPAARRDRPSPGVEAGAAARPAWRRRRSRSPGRAMREPLRPVAEARPRRPARRTSAPSR